MKTFYLTLAFIIISSISALSQVIPAEDPTAPIDISDSIRNEFENGPYFGLYKDNYFVVGTSLGPKVTKENSNVKFQISIAQRLTKSVLPFHSYLYLFYSQKVIWNVFENSLPMRDMNFNPGLGWSKPFFSKNRYVGKLTLLIEHESNGRDGAESRSWNKISLAGSVLIDEWLMVHGKVWIPIIDGMNNKDILKYSGIYQTGVEVSTPDRKFIWDLTLVKRKGWNLNFNTILEFSWRFSKKANEYFFLQYYNGYGECLLDYNVFKSQIRAGIVIKPKFFSEF